MTKNKLQSGYAIVYLLVIIFISSLILFPIVNLVAGKMAVINSVVAKEQALQIAEAGINYYEWFLANNPGNYNNQEQDFTDSITGKIIGHFTLEITAPTENSDIVIIKSTGWTTEKPEIKRVITVHYGPNSVASYSFISDSPVWITNNEKISGKLHSNDGIRFDGETNSIVSSGKDTYTCKVDQGCSPNQVKSGIWGLARDPIKQLWQYPTTNIDFNNFDTVYNSIKTDSQTNGLYLLPSGLNGYSLVLNGNQIEIYKVLTLQNNSPAIGKDTEGNTRNEKTDYDSIQLFDSVNIPSNGLVFVDDKVWVEGNLDGQLTVAAPTIYIPDNLFYQDSDGSDSLGLLAEDDIVITNHAPDDLEINAGLIATKGAVQRFYYSNDIKDNLTINGSIISNKPWAWTWLNGSNQIQSGYQSVSINAENSQFLKLNPPPLFPKLSNTFVELNWSVE